MYGTLCPSTTNWRSRWTTPENFAPEDSTKTTISIIVASSKTREER